MRLAWPPAHAAAKPSQARSWSARALDDPHRTALATALLLATLTLPSGVAMLLDDRLIQGTSNWTKPMKFQWSFALHWLTLAWLLSGMHVAARASARLQRWVFAGAIAAIVEVAYITLQGARGRASHFNVETVWETVLYYGLMGGAAVLMVIATLVVGLWLRQHPGPQLGPGLRLGAVLGLVVGSLATLVVTAPLAAGAIDGPGPWVGGIRSNAAGLPLTGWSTTGGELRVPHFVATHLVQVMPIAGWLADRTLPVQMRSRVVWLTLSVLLVMTIATFAQAVSGAPLIGR